MTNSFTCFACGRPVEVGSPQCANCKATFDAPVCPHCTQPVARPSRKSDSSYQVCSAWNTDWNGRCQMCGHEFSASVALATGHHRFFEVDRTAALRDAVATGGDPFAGRSTLGICGSESTYMMCDEWDHQPTIEISVERAVSGNAGRRESRLPQSGRLVLTLDECRELIRQLQGPLEVLLRRQPWSEDTT